MIAWLGSLFLWFSVDVVVSEIIKEGNTLFCKRDRPGPYFPPEKPKKQLFHVIKHCFWQPSLQIQSAVHYRSAMILKNLFNLCVASIPPADAALREDAKNVFESSDQTYGSRRMARALRALGHPVGRFQARSLMRRLGLRVQHVNVTDGRQAVVGDTNTRLHSTSLA
jgi:hypothetical protein